MWAARHARSQEPAEPPPPPRAVLQAMQRRPENRPGESPPPIPCGAQGNRQEGGPPGKAEGFSGLWGTQRLGGNAETCFPGTFGPPFLTRAEWRSG